MVYNVLIAAEQQRRAVSRSGTCEDVNKVTAAPRESTPEARCLGRTDGCNNTMYRSNQQFAFLIGRRFITKGKKEPIRRAEIATE